jgi:hypothetical protein
LITFQTYSIKRTGGNEQDTYNQRPTDNPFDIGKDFLGIDSRTSIGGKNARKKREKQKQLDEIKETDLKADLAKGNTLISYTEYQPQ